MHFELTPPWFICFTARVVIRIVPPSITVDTVGGLERAMHAHRVMGAGGAIGRELADRSESESEGTGQARQLDTHLFGFFHHVVHWSFSVLLSTCDPPSLADAVPKQ